MKKARRPTLGAPMNPKFVWLSPHFLLDLLEYKKRFDIRISGNSQVSGIGCRGLLLDSNPLRILVVDNPIF
jgi:hypothetical protein